eukprot:1738617-Amphidinium_carterae.1
MIVGGQRGVAPSRDVVSRCGVLQFLTYDICCRQELRRNYWALFNLEPNDRGRGTGGYPAAPFAFPAFPFKLFVACTRPSQGSWSRQNTTK